MIVFVDTNVIIDFYQRREPFFFPAATILDLAQSGHFEVSISTATILNSFYILRKSYDRAELYSKMRGLMSFVKDALAELIAFSLEGCTLSNRVRSARYISKLERCLEGSTLYVIVGLRMR